MIVKYAYNKEIIENEVESNTNKNFAEDCNEIFEDLIENLYSIDVTDRIFRKIKKNHKLVKEHMNLFLDAVMRGKVDILEIMRPYLNNKIVKGHNNEAFRVAAKKGHLNVLKWLKENYNITEKDAKLNNNSTFSWAALFGHLEVLKWLKKTFKITEEEAKTYNNQAFRWAAIYGHLDVLKWLKETFNITEKEAKINNNEAFRWAANNGHLDVLKWLKETYNITE
jgi:ankyrin repeat protein